jgi:hypothetical protein
MKQKNTVDTSKPCNSKGKMSFGNTKEYLGSLTKFGHNTPTAGHGTPKKITKSAQEF